MMRTLLSALILSALSSAAVAHDPSSATYIANEGVLVTSGETKVMFDPLFREGFGTYLTVPDDTHTKMMNGEAPFDGVDAVFISHAHGDHFAAKDVAAYLDAQPEVTLFAPQQAIDRLMLAADPKSGIAGRVVAFDLAAGDAVQNETRGDITAEAVRIPHAGWPAPRRASVQNIVFRVTLNEDVTVMHMGDADVNMAHYRPHAAHWQARGTDTAFPPYWMLTAPGGSQILEYMNVESSVGTHVPIKVPSDLKNSGKDYFSVPGETRVIGGGHAHD